jgi:hypothetical protein
MRLSVPRFIGLAVSATLLAFLIPATSRAATSNSGSIGSPALTAQAASANNGSIAESPSTGTPATVPGANWANCVNGTCTIALDHGRTQALISILGAKPSGPPQLAAVFALCNAYTFGALRVACTVFAAWAVADASLLHQQLSDEDMGYGVYITLSVTNPASTGVTPRPATPLYITQVTTYTQGVFVYFKITYADPGNNAEGFGFVGVNGSGWAEETHPFSSSSYGIVGPNSIAYPFNQECGTEEQTDSYVQAWIYDTAGDLTKPVTIHLVCTSTGT